MLNKIMSLSFLEKIISLVILLGIFVSSLFVPSDPDLGWHLKYGEYFFQYGRVLKENIFSQLMPGYQWSNSSWLTDLLTYQIFKNFDFIGLSIAGALIIVLTFYFLGKAAKLDLFEKSIIFPVIFYLVTPVNRISMRGQLLSLLFIAMMFYFLSKYEGKTKKHVLLLIPLFALWSNIHGEFIFGAGLFGIWVLTYSIKELYLNYKTDIKKFAKDNKLLILAVVGSAAATLINPFGVGVYLETIKHFGDPLLKSVTEWLSPADFSSVWWHQLFMGLAISMGFVMLGVGRRNLDLAPFYSPSLILFIFTFWIRRYAWPFYYSTVFLLKPVVAFLKPEGKKHTVLASSFFAFLFLFTAVFTKYPFSDIRQMNWNNYCKKSVGCSPTAAKTVIAYKLNNDRLFTIYDYGGWLIWNYPQIKPTIDGRMHLWRDENGYSGFEYFYSIEQGINGASIDNSPYDAVLTSKKKSTYKTMVQLYKQRKWRPIHVDKYSALFVRVK